MVPRLRKRRETKNYLYRGKRKGREGGGGEEGVQELSRPVLSEICPLSKTVVPNEQLFLTTIRYIAIKELLQISRINGGTFPFCAQFCSSINHSC